MNPPQTNVKLSVTDSLEVSSFNPSDVDLWKAINFFVFNRKEDTTTEKQAKQILVEYGTGITSQNEDFGYTACRMELRNDEPVVFITWKKHKLKFYFEQIASFQISVQENALTTVHPFINDIEDDGKLKRGTAAYFLIMKIIKRHQDVATRFILNEQLGANKEHALLKLKYALKERNELFV